MVSLYEKIGPSLFVDPMPDSKVQAGLWGLRNRNKPANPSAPLKDALASVFGDATLGSVYEKNRIALCLPACRLLDWTPKVFKTPHLPNLTRDRDVTLVDACLATSAAPIFLPVAEVRETADATHLGKFIDGGLWANNPTVVALIEAIDICAECAGADATRPIQLLSIGTSGGAAGDGPHDGVNRGLLHWKFGAEIANMSITVQGYGSDFIMKKLIAQFNRLGLQIQYGRIPNPPVNEAQARELKLDRATPAAIDLLKQLGDTQAQAVESQCAQHTPLGDLVTSIFS
jgi:hypothetical protein